MQFGAPTWFWLLAFFLFGLVFGSFGNVVIWRLPRGESLSEPPSHCPNCGAGIRWYDNVPVLSWLLLRARCRACGNPISPRYPTVELISGLLALGAGLRFGPTLVGVFAAVFFYVLLLLAFIDWDTMRLPNQLLLFLLGVGAAGVAVSQLAGVQAAPLLASGRGMFAAPAFSALVGAVISAGIMLGISLAYTAVRGGQGYGMGDVKLIAVMGVFLGLYALMAMFFATLLGTIYGAISAARAGEGGRHRFPFGPFLVAAAVLVTLAGPEMWHWYAALSGIRL